MKKIAQFIVHSKAATIVAALLCLYMWLSSNAEEGRTALTILQFLLYTLVGLQLIGVNTKLSIDNQKEAFPLTLFFMCCSIVPQPGTWLPYTILLLMAAATSFILQTYRDSQAMASYFAAFSLISAGSLYVPQIVYLMPILLLCCGFMQSLHLRSAIAALLGMLFPYWISYCLLFLTDNTQRIGIFVETLTTKTTYNISSLVLPLGQGNTLTLPTIAVQTAWTLLVAIPAITNLLFTVKSKMQARAAQLFQSAIIIVLIVASFVLPALYQPLQPIISLLAAALGSTLFTSNLSHSKNIWLIVLLLLWMLTASLCLWNKFLTF